MKMTDLGITYSLKRLVLDEMDVNCIVHRDDMTLPKEKPFVSVRGIQRLNSSISKQRETISTTFAYQVGIFANSLSERSALQEELSDLFLFHEIPYYTEDGTLTSHSFMVNEDFSVFPMPSDSITNTTEHHRLYYDLTVDGLRHKANYKKERN